MGTGDPAVDEDEHMAEAGESTADEPTEEEPTEDVDDEDEPPRPPRRWLGTVLVLVVILVAALVTGALHLRSVLDYRATDDRRDAIMSVAREVAELSYSLDYQSFPRQVSRIIAASTGNYRKGLVDGAKGLGYLLSEGKVRSTCTVTAAGIERDDENTATVLFAITTRLTNTEIRQPQTRYYRVAIGLVRQGDQWLVQSNDVVA
ncbi:hypothetical protein [Actinophytocola oryzae]|uniref:Mce-associated membrane protein n=1 Tax=Actinophytocola oryzae TaxID=502181 RepID=A0A4R7VYU1_9PSEU|nr:hypothetical protein [Actinophytocola oryzae]TDV55350.1 hypothetical protein CLV71_103591 [Actinophytocola oryzae]